MDVGEVGDNSFKINRTVFGKNRSGEFGYFGILGDVTGNGNVNQSTNIGFDGRSSAGENGLVVGTMKYHGIMATGSDIFGDQ